MIRTVAKGAHSPRAVASELKRGSKNLPGEEKKAMLRALAYLKGQIQEGLSGRFLNRRSGTLSGSLNTRVREANRRLQGVIGSWVPYARIQDQGGKIAPRNVKYLTIPFPDGPVLTGAGVARGSARDFDLHFYQSQSGTPLLVEGYGPDMIPYFILRRDPVNLPGTGYFSKPIRKNTRRVAAYLSDGAGRAMQKAGIGVRKGSS